MSFFFNGGFPFDMGGMPGGTSFGQQEKPKKDVNTSRYYEILGVTKTATNDELRKAYRKLAKIKHPDKGGNDAEFQELQTAYDVLSDENKRKVYDTYGEEGLAEGRDGTEGADIFDILNGRGRQGGKRKTKSVLHNLSVTLEEVYAGKDKYFEISRYRICEPCKGSGSKDPNANTKCKGCDGKGIKLVIQRMPMGIVQTQQECYECRGEGYVIKEKDKCPQCKGEKATKQNKMIKVSLDKGAPDGKRYTFKGESDEIPDYEPGDVIVEIAIKKHKEFVRKGADLIYNCDITLLEALTGFEFVVTHLDGRKFLVKTRPNEIIKPGVLKTVKECGMPFFESPYRFGNMYINFNIRFPDKIDDGQEKKLQDLFPSAQMAVDKDEKITEKYTMTEFKQEDENPYATGGKKKRRDENDDDQDGFQGGRQVRCENQ